MIETIISGAFDVAGSLASNILKRNDLKKIKRDLQSRRAQNDAWYSRAMGEDPTQRADAQALITRTEEALRRQTRASQATQAVAGGTAAATAVQKEAAAKALADQAAQIVADAETRRDSLAHEYRTRDEKLFSMHNA